MANLFVFLLAAIWPLAKKVLLMLGIGWVTYEGVGLLVGQVTTEVVALWGGIPTAMLQIASLGGLPQSVGIILGAIAARASLVALSHLGKVTT